MKNIDIDIDMVILVNIDIDMDFLENIDIDKGILKNIDIDKISYRLEFGISNRVSADSLQENIESGPVRPEKLDSRLQWVQLSHTCPYSG